MSVKLLTEHHLELLSLIGGCTGSSESTLVKNTLCWKSHVAAHMYMYLANKVTFLYLKPSFHCTAIPPRFEIFGQNDTNRSRNDKSAVEVPRS